MTRVLLVEDEVRLAAAVRSGLIAEGFAVDIAANGVEGQWLAEEHPYDLIVLDIMLPERNGFEVCEALRSAGNWTPILMLTARDGPSDVAQALNAGADDYLSKPFAFIELVARLRALLRRGRAEKPAALVAGNVRLDPATHRCWKGDREIELTAREFSVLEFLLRRDGGVASKLDILENVWDFAFEGDPNIVEVYVRRLRMKLGEPGSAGTIETVRGVGYRLSPEGRHDR
jgi:DNA-binding response OmpR family regulator